MVNDDERTARAVESAKKADRERSQSDDRDYGGMFCVEVPHQQLWLFTKVAAVRAVEALKILGLKGKFSTKGLKK